MPSTSTAQRRRQQEGERREMESEQRQEESEESGEVYYEIRLPLWLLLVLLVTALAALGVYLHVVGYGDRGFYEAFGVRYVPDDHANPPPLSLQLTADELVRRLGPADAKLFARLDRDGSGLLSMPEFEPLAHHVRQDWRHPLTKQVLDAGPPCAPPGVCVPLRYRVLPPSPASTLLYDGGRRLRPLGENAKGDSPSAQLLEALSTHAPVDAVVEQDAIDIATALLPQSRQLSVELGRPYELLGPGFSDEMQRKQLRRRPSVQFEVWEAALARLTRPLHPAGGGVHLFARRPEGVGADSAAVVRAVSKNSAEILFRLRLEFDLANRTSQRSVFLVPAGVEGRLVVTTPQGGMPQPVSLVARLVGRRQGGANCLIDVPVDDQRLVAHVEFPEISIAMTTPGTPVANWSREVPEEAAWRSLRHMAMPFLANGFHDSLAEAIAAARSESRPLHVVLAIGSEDYDSDQAAKTLRELAFGHDLVRLRLKYHCSSVWLSLADLANEASRRRLFNGLTPEDAERLAKAFNVEELGENLPLRCLLLDSGSLRQLAAFEHEHLQKALRPPEHLPDPFETSQPAQQLSAEGDEPPPVSRLPGERRLLLREAFEVVAKQVAKAYMRFLMAKN